jgi:hypothetical protein
MHLFASKQRACLGNGRDHVADEFPTSLTRAFHALSHRPEHLRHIDGGLAPAPDDELAIVAGVVPLVEAL